MSENSIPRDKLDIYAMRIFAKYLQKNEQILFAPKFQVAQIDAAGGKHSWKLPLSVCIRNVQENTTQPLRELTPQCISDIRFVLCDTSQEIRCTQKAIITVDYKLILLVKYSNCRYECITLPDDAQGDDPRVVIDGLTPNGEPFRVGNQTLAIIREGTVGNYNYFFRFTDIVPFKEFSGDIPREIMDDPTLQSHVLISNLKFAVDIDGECPFDPQDPPEVGSTKVYLSVYADICDKMGVYQDIEVEGSPLDC